MSKINDASEDYTPKEQTPEDLFYAAGATAPGGIYDSAIKPGLDHLADSIGLSGTEREELRVQSAAQFFQLNLSPLEAGRMHDLISRNLVNPPDSQTQQNWRLEARQGLRETYGPDADRLLLKANRYIKKVGLASTLNESGVGDHPEIVKLMVEKVRGRHD